MWVHVVCFFTSYVIALCLEASRLFFRMPARWFVMAAFATMGVALHAVYLYHRAQTGTMPLSSWHDWYLVAAWVLAAGYLLLMASRPQTNVGLFLLPVVLVLIAVAKAFGDQAAFPPER